MRPDSRSIAILAVSLIVTMTAGISWWVLCANRNHYAGFSSGAGNTHVLLEVTDGKLTFISGDETYFRGSMIYTSNMTDYSFAGLRLRTARAFADIANELTIPLGWIAALPSIAVVAAFAGQWPVRLLQQRAKRPGFPVLRIRADT